MPAKKQKQPADSSGVTGYSYSSSDAHSGDTISIDLSDYMSNYTIDTSVTMPTVSWTSSDYTITGSSYDPYVNIDSNGIGMKAEADIKIGERSLKDFMDSVEDRLAILRPNPELEDRWDKLKELRREYEALEKEILEKEKMWNILKKND